MTDQVIIDFLHDTNMGTLSKTTTTITEEKADNTIIIPAIGEVKFLHPQPLPFQDEGLKVWFLERLEGKSRGAYHNWVVIAKNEKSAREIICQKLTKHEQEDWEKYYDVKPSREKILNKILSGENWDNPDFATCKLVSKCAEQETPGVVNYFYWHS